VNKAGTIVYVGGFEMPDKNAAAHRVLNNAKIFSQIGYHTVFCGIDKQIENNCEKAIKIDNFDSFPAKYPKNNIEWFKNLMGFKHIKSVIERYPDTAFVVAYNLHAIPLNRLIRYCKKKNIKVIADITEWYEYKFSIHPIKFIKWYDTKTVMTKLHKKTDGIIAISAFLKEYYSPFVKKIIQLPPLVDISQEIWQQEPKNTNDKIEFVYSGVPGRGEEKDKIGLLVEAFSNLSVDNDFLFTIIGITKKQFELDFPEYKSSVAKMGEKIQFCGRVSHFDSVQALKRADYCIFIRNRNQRNVMAGFPTKFVECITSGIGIIANRISNIDDYASFGNCTFLEKEDMSYIEQTIKEKLQKNKKITHLVADVFDYKRYFDVMKQFLNAI